MQLTEAQRRLAEDGYEVFFRTFVMDNPLTYISYKNFVAKHFSNPDILSTPGVVEYRDGTPVAVQFYLGTRLLYKGQEVVCAQAADTAAVEEGRGMPFLRMFIGGDRIQRSDGVPFRFGTPNENSFPVVTKLKDVHIGAFAHMLFDCSARISGRPASCYVFESDECLLSQDELAIVNSCSNSIQTKKSKDYFSWKTSMPNDARLFTHLKVLLDGRFAGYFVIFDYGGKMATICDWGVYGESSANDEAVVCAFLQHVRGRYTALRLPCVNELAGEAELMGACGFELVRDQSGEPIRDDLCVAQYADELDSVFFDFSKWCLHMIDLDYFLNAYQSIEDLG